MMMCAAKVPFTLFLFDLIEDNENKWKSDYFQAKDGFITKYHTPLWNLPFCVDRSNKRVICQTNAVFAYLGRACGMYGADDNTTSQCEQLLCELYDLRNIMVGYSYGGDKDDGVPSRTLEKAKGHFKKLEAWLQAQAQATQNSSDESNKNVVVHLVDGKFSAPDFHLYEMLDQFEAFVKCYNLENFLDDVNFGRLKAFKEGFSLLE
jgi:hypothetical protein